SLQVTSASAQGPRLHQEDRWLCEAVRGGFILAVFDGHRGSATADFAHQHFLPILESSLRPDAHSVPDALRDVFAQLNQKTATELSGATASAVFIPDRAETLYWAVLGDSPIALLDAYGKIHIGPDHNVRTNPQECAAAEARGGIIYGGYLEDP